MKYDIETLKRFATADQIVQTILISKQVFDVDNNYNTTNVKSGDQLHQIFDKFGFTDEDQWFELKEAVQTQQIAPYIGKELEDLFLKLNIKPFYPVKLKKKIRF